MVGQKPLTAFFKPLNNGGVKRTIAQALNIPDTLENKNPQQQVEYTRQFYTFFRKWFR